MQVLLIFGTRFQASRSAAAPPDLPMCFASRLKLNSRRPLSPKQPTAFAGCSHLCRRALPHAGRPQVYNFSLFDQSVTGITDFSSLPLYNVPANWAIGRRP